MKRSFFVILLLTQFQSFSQSTIHSSPKIEKVTVFLNKAQLETTVNISIPKGKSTILIEDLAGTTDPSTIQIKGEGQFSILSTSYQNSTSNSRKVKYLDSLDEITAKIQEVKVMIDVAEKETTMITQNAANIKSTTDGLFADEFKEMIEFTRKKLTEVGTRKLAHIRDLEKLTKKKEEILNKINSMGGVSQLLGEVLVTVIANNPTLAKINLTYLVNNAGWSPTYDIRSEGVNQPVKIGYRANVYQQTGIDWENVNLVLSSTNPNINNTKPELYPQFLSEMVQNDLMARGLKVASAPMYAMDSPQDEVSLANGISVTESAMAVNFSIALPYTILSTGKPELVDIQQFNLPATYEYVAVPKFSTTGFLVSKISDWEKLNILPGVASIYFENAFIGKTSMNGSETKDELSVSLGAVSKLIVERKELLDFKSSRTIGGSIRENFSYETTIRNTKNEAVNLIVEEQVPVSQDSRIEVNFEPENGMMYDKTTGKVTYNLTLQPNQTIQKRINYEVKYPKDLRVSNL